MFHHFCYASEYIKYLIKILSSGFQVTKLKQAPPIPVDIFVAQRTKVLVITGPNTGGKTIYLKTIGLAAVMAKSGWIGISLDQLSLVATCPLHL